MRTKQQTYSTNEEVTSADLNAIQTRALDGRTMSEDTAELGALTQTKLGDTAYFQRSASVLAVSSELKVDGSDWRGCLIEVEYTELNNATDVIGGSAEPFVNVSFEAGTTRMILFAGTGANRANNPLTRAGGDYFIGITADIQVFADSVNGSLYVRNISGANTHRFLLSARSVVGYAP